MPTQYDAIVIGTGQAAPALANRLNREGLQVAVVERDRIGGTCVNVGCTPTKALVASARAAHMARRGPEFGVALQEPVRVDMKRVNARMKAISGQSSDNLTHWLEGMENVTVYRAHARFTSPDTVEVDGQLLRAERIFVNVGTRAFAPPMPGLDQIEYLTNTSIMEVSPTEVQAPPG